MPPAAAARGKNDALDTFRMLDGHPTLSPLEKDDDSNHRKGDYTQKCELRNRNRLLLYLHHQAFQTTWKTRDNTAEDDETNPVADTPFGNLLTKPH